MIEPINENTTLVITLSKVDSKITKFDLLNIRINASNIPVTWGKIVGSFLLKASNSQAKINNNIEIELYIIFLCVEVFTW